MEVTAIVPALVAGWVWAAAFGGVALIGFIVAVVALRSAHKRASQLEGLDTSVHSPLSLLGTPAPARSPEPSAPPVVEVVVPPAPEPVAEIEETRPLVSEAVPIPVVQMPVVPEPPPAPVAPPVVVPPTMSLNPDPAVIASAETQLVGQVIEDISTTGEHSMSPDPKSPEEILARQIAQQIAERRARLTAPVGSMEVPSPAPLSQSAETLPAAPVVESAPLPRFVPPPPVAPRQPVLGEQLPPSTRRLRPPTSTEANVSAVAPTASMRIPDTVPVPAIPVPTSARAVPVPPSAPVVPVAVEHPVEIFPQPSVPGDQPTPTLSFLEPGGERGYADRSYERRRLAGLFIALILGGTVLACIFNSKVRGYLPAPVATRLAEIPIRMGLEDRPPPPFIIKVEVNEYQVAYKATPVKDARIALIGGVIRNISAEPLVNLRVELQLRRRDQGTLPPETRIVPVAPATLEPGKEGRYDTEVSDKEYSSAKFTRVLAADNTAIPHKPAGTIARPVEPGQKLEDRKLEILK